VSDPASPDPDFYDAELGRLNVHFRAAAGVRRGDHVLDIGCGTGETTRDAARTAVDGSATGVDTSAATLEHARRRTEAEGLPNVDFVLGDAQTHHFPPAHFDLCISRFGAMFFTDPVAAFANIGRALRRGARLVLLVWQGPERNEWFVAPRAALRSPNPAAPAASDVDPFSLADPAAAQRILTSAGFVEVGFAAVREPVYYGATCDAAYDAMLRLWHVRDLVTDLDSSTADDARGRLRAMLRGHDTGDGVLFDSSAWIVTARWR
jgi:SAM-dependent methyltransferase